MNKQKLTDMDLSKSRHQRIKQATSTLHQALEDCPTLDCLKQKTHLSQDTYKATLAGLYGILSPLENNVTSQHTTQHLLTDLSKLGIQSIPFQMPLDQPSPSQKLARKYILLGSRLGAKWIAKHLEKYQPQLPSSYFKIAGEQADNWRIFLNTLETKKINEHVLINEINILYKLMIQQLQKGK